ncbi:MAG: RNA-binding S4 domain-containing protein [Alphaproteobacteria bacterium]|jgi:ribosome-associated heat shock protein Hsp15|nr:RNA-binding S4 domain-containing protein [Alphaproteobacteria bacterium]
MSEAPPPPPDAADAGGSLRLDKWLWFARFFKSRSLASTQCQAGKVRVDGGVVTKAHFSVRPGHVLTFVQGNHVRVVKVLALGCRRGPSPEAQQLYEDLAPPTPETALPRDPAAAPRPKGAGRPTKKQRRETTSLKEVDWE